MKIAFFDIDGTLLDFGAKEISAAVRDALLELQAKGVKLFIATGRAPYLIPTLAGIDFDGVLSFNGSFCFDRAGMIFSQPMEHADMVTVIANARQQNLPVMVATREMMAGHFHEQAIDDYMKINSKACRITDDYDALQREEVFQLMIGADETLDGVLLADTSAVKLARWCPDAVDVIPAHCGKALGMRKILEHYGFDREDSIAFGDGGNDLDMLEYAGIGVAMGNAGERLKAAADYVTDTCREDGVRTALRHFGLIEG